MTSVMTSDLICSNVPVNWNNNLDNKVRNRVLISIVVPANKCANVDELSLWNPFKMEDIEGIIMATSNGVSKGATSLGTASSALTWSNTKITYGNAPSSGDVEILLVGRMK